jgi:hypothetical protein
MNEQDWLTSSDPVLLMCGLQDRISSRKYNLFEIACAESMSATWPDPLCRDYLDRMSRLVEGNVGTDKEDEEFDRLTDEIRELAQLANERAEAVFAERGELDPAVHDAVRTSVALELLNFLVSDVAEWWYVLPALSESDPSTLPSEEAKILLLDVYRDHLPLLRCIVGNPFRPVACDPSWRTATAVGLAEVIYAERAFDRLPILADALEDAGCTHPGVLAHCRGDGPHARGCWVVDLVLGKA